MHWKNKHNLRQAKNVVGCFVVPFRIDKGNEASQIIIYFHKSYRINKKLNKNNKKLFLASYSIYDNDNDFILHFVG